MEISFNDAVPEYEYTITGFVNGEEEQHVVSGRPVLSCDYTVGDAVGTYEITLTIGDLSSDNYDFTFVNGELSVGLASQAELIINSVGTKTYGDPKFNLSVTGGTGTGNISYKLISGSDVIQIKRSTGEVFIKRAGTAVVRARKGGDSEYSPVHSETIIITVNKRNLSNVKVNITETFIYTGQSHEPVPSVRDRGLVNISDWDVSLYSDNINAGTEAVVTITAREDGNYTGTQSGTFTIKKATLTVTADDKNITYNSEAPVYSYTITGFVNEEGEGVITGTPDLSSSYTPGKPLGNYTITPVTGTLSADNYDFTFATGVLSVGLANQAELIISDPGVKTYGDMPFTLSTTGGTGTGMVNYTVESGDDVISITGETVTILNAGTAEVLAVRQGDENYNPVTSEVITITVNKRNLSNAAVNVTGTFTYTGLAHQPEPSVTDGSLIDDSDWFVTYSNNVNAGTASVVINAEEDGNYTGTKSINFTINKAMLTIMADNKNISFNSPAPSFTYTITGFVNGETASALTGVPGLSSNYTAGSSVGNYTITAVIGTLTSANYNFTFANGTLSVGLTNQATLTINNPGVKTYGEAAFTLSTAGGSGTGAVSYIVTSGSNVISISGATVTILRSGTATVTATKQSDGNFSSISSAPITITINKRNISNAAVNVTGTFNYTGLAHQPTPAVTDGGLISSSDWVVTYSNNVNAGTATVNVTATTGGNYTGTRSANFTINRVPLTVRADNKNTVYNSPAPAFTFTITGFVNGETSSVVSGVAGLSCGYTVGGPVGSYVIYYVNENLTSANYNFTFANGILTVGQANQATLTITNPGAKTYGDAAFTLSTTGGTTTGAVSYTVTSGNNVVSISGATVTIHNAGNALVTATKQGDGNFNPVTSPPIVITVNKRSIGHAELNVSWATFTYNGQEHRPTVTVTDGDLIKTSDWFVTYSNNINAGTAMIYINSADNGNYFSGLSESFYINRADTVVTWPTNLVAQPGMLLHQVELPGNLSSNTPGSLTWRNPNDGVGNVGYPVHFITFTPHDSMNYNTISTYVAVTVGCIVIFNPGPGSSVSNQLLPSGSLVTRPANPTYNAHTFDYWYIDSERTIPFDFTAPLNIYGQIVLNAKWIPDSTRAQMSGRGMIWIPGGTFRMGSPSTEPGRSTIENFRTANNGNVTLSGFWMGRYQVTQELYQSVMGSNPSWFHGGTGREPTEGEVQSRRPVEQVSWYHAIAFCNRLSIREDLNPAYRINGSTNPDDWGSVPISSNATWNAVQIVDGSNGYRLPTEAQWEYACRAGTTTRWHFGDDQNQLVNYAWYSANSNNRTHEVGRRSSNAWGLYDMYGNVYEFCWDWYNSSYNNAGGNVNPMGAVSGASRVARGGLWNNDGSDLRSAYRDYYYPAYRDSSIGFRLVRP